jgi:hypothetical protein
MANGGEAPKGTVRLVPTDEKNRNCRQETDSHQRRIAASMVPVNGNHYDVQIESSAHRSARAALAVTIAIVLFFNPVDRSRAQGAAAAQPRKTPPRTTLVVFADRRMEDRQWSALFDQLRRNLPEAAAESQAIAGALEIVRGDSMPPGLRVETAIVVYLHGDCNLEPLVRRSAFGVPLGWVLEINGRIEPFVHLDCTRIGQELGARAAGLNRDRRIAMMACAMSRVILHEWVHIAKQSSQHGKRGISKAQFDVSDLTSGDSQPIAGLRGPS